MKDVSEAVFKNNAGKWLTKALFFETSIGDRQYAVFTTKSEDHIVDGTIYVSLRKLFLACDDPTEYEFANKWLGGWEHWKVLSEAAELKPYVQDWREERDVKLRSQGVKKLVDMAKSEESSYQAAKWLADKGWEENAKRGRPSKQDIKREANQMAKVKSKVGIDKERIMSLAK